MKKLLYYAAMWACGIGGGVAIYFVYLYAKHYIF